MLIHSHDAGLQFLPALHLAELWATLSTGILVTEFGLGFMFLLIVFKEYPAGLDDSVNKRNSNRQYVISVFSLLAINRLCNLTLL